MQPEGLRGIKWAEALGGTATALAPKLRNNWLRIPIASRFKARISQKSATRGDYPPQPSKRWKGELGSKTDLKTTLGYSDGAVRPPFGPGNRGRKRGSYHPGPFRYHKNAERTRLPSPSSARPRARFPPGYGSRAGAEASAGPSPFTGVAPIAIGGLHGGPSPYPVVQVTSVKWVFAGNRLG